MTIEKKTETVEFENRVVSIDGRYSRSIKGATEEQKQAAIDSVKEYEKSAKCVLMSRLLESGVLKKVLKPVTRFKEENGVKTAVEWQDLEDKSLYIRKMALYALDSVIDDGNERTDFYTFTPATEEDIKDLCILAKLNNVYRPEMTAWNCDKWAENMFIGADKVEAGKNYILAINDDCERWELFEFDHMLSQFKKMVDHFADIAKAQRKALSK